MSNRNSIERQTQTNLDMHHLNNDLNNENENSRNQKGIEYETNKIQVNWNEYIPVEQFEAKVNHLDEEKKEIIFEIVDEYGDVFAKNDFDIGEVKGKDCEACIELIENKYISRRPYRCSWEDQKEIERQVGELLKHGLIQESYSPFAAPVTLAYKKTGVGNERKKTRLCMDFTALNKLVIPESQPFPLISDLIEKTRGCQWYSAFDINVAFWSIPIRKKDRFKTGFVTTQSHYEWRSLPFGISCASSIFQRILSNIIRRNDLSEFCANYIDDILIFSRSFSEHVKHIRSLLDAIRKEGFRLKFLKCSFATNSVKYLGHVIEKDTVRPLNDNVIAIKEFPTPQTKKNVRQFLGKINFYHKYIPNAAKFLEPFYKLLRKDTDFIWSKECKDTFDKIKGYLASAPALAIFDPNLPIIIYSDASLLGLGAVLKQVQENEEEKTVAYFSKKLNDSQKKKKAIFIESLAIQEAIKYWKYWLIGRKFKVITDHKPLEGLNIKSRPDEELGDIINFLSQFSFEIFYRPGSANSEADCLSRNPVLPSDESDLDCELIRTINVLELEELRLGQEGIEKRERDEVKQGIIFRKVRKKRKIVLNEETGWKVIKSVHEKFGHIGTRQMCDMIRLHFHFRNMYTKIRSYCQNCEICIKNKSRSGEKLGLMGHYGPASRPFEIMSLDTVGGFGGKRSRKKYLHILIDHFTRFMYISTSKNQTAIKFIKLIHKVSNENRIQTLMTDQYGGLGSEEFEAFLKQENISHVFTSVDNASSNGLNERVGQSVTNRLRCKVNTKKNEKKSWSTLAEDCVREYNDSVHASTGFTPNYLMNGIQPELIPKILAEKHDFLSDRKKAFENSQKAHEQNKKRYDLGRKDVEFEVGDEVYVSSGNKLNRDKLDEIRVGPFVVQEKLSKTVYRLAKGNKKSESLNFHISKMVPKRDVIEE